MTHETLMLELAPTAVPAGVAPREIVIFQAGWSDAPNPVEGPGGRMLCDEQAARTVIAGFRADGRDVVIDYEHATQYADERHDGTAPAAGWIKALRWDPSRGLVATVEWTALGRRRLAEREYRYHSPVVVVHTETRRVLRLISVALTNYPALRNPQPLVARGSSPSGTAAMTTGGDPSMDAIAQMVGLEPGATVEQILGALTADNMSAVAEALGLPPDASREEIEMALNETRKSGGGSGNSGSGGGAGPSGQGAGASITARDAWARRFAADIGLPNVSSGDGLVAALKAQLAAAGATAAEVTALRVKLDTVERGQAEHDWERIVAGDCGKKIPPAARGEFKALCLKDRAQFEALVKTLPVLGGEASVLTGGASAAGADDWETNAELRAEFRGDKKRWEAFREADEAGLVNILKR